MSFTFNALVLTCITVAGPFPIGADIIAEWEVSEPDDDIAMAGPESDEHSHRDEDATTLTESAPATGSIATLRPKATAGLKRSRVIESSSESESDVVAPVRAPILKKRRIQKGKASKSCHGYTRPRVHSTYHAFR